MNKDELKKLVYSTERGSGYYVRESVWKKSFPEFHNDLMSWVFPDNFSFPQRVYHYINDDPDLHLGLCSVCGKRCGFEGVTRGYRRFCSNKCSSSSDESKEKKKQTCIAKYGCENVSQSEDSKEKRKETWLGKYGVEHPFQSDSVKEKRKETWLETYGVEHPFQVEKVKEKKKQTCLERYGVEHPFQRKEIQEKYKETCLEKYGVEYGGQSDGAKEKKKQTCLDRYGRENVSQIDEVREKRKETMSERYGDENYNNHEKTKQTCLEKYGVENPAQLDDVQEKKKQTCREKYGTEYYVQTDGFKDKYKDSEWVKSKLEKSYQTKKKNNTFSSSKIEDQLKEYFDLNNINYIYQYRSELYPFSCDFYFPDRDLYVEIQGSWTHGPHPFAGSEEDMDVLNLWKSKGTEYYENAISVWTISDVRKRETAEKNKLNWVEIFSRDLTICIDKILNLLSTDLKK